MSQQESKRPHSQESMQWLHQPCIKSKPITTDFCMWRDQQSGGAGRIHKVCQTNAQPPKHQNWRKLHCLSQVHRHIQQVPPVLDLEVSLVEELQDGHCGLRQPAQHAQRDSEQLLQHPMTCLYPPPATPTAASVTPYDGTRGHVLSTLCLKQGPASRTAGNPLPTVWYFPNYAAPCSRVSPLRLRKLCGGGGWHGVGLCAGGLQENDQSHT